MLGNERFTTSQNVSSWITYYLQIWNNSFIIEKTKTKPDLYHLKFNVTNGGKNWNLVFPEVIP